MDKATVNDDRLSFRARGILLWLLEKPDDWRCDSEVIARAGTEGREAVRTALKELLALGYLRRTKAHGPHGHWQNITDVFERPVATDDGFPVVGSPVVGKPVVGKPGDGFPVLITEEEVPIPKTEEEPQRTERESAASAVDNSRPLPAVVAGSAHIDDATRLCQLFADQLTERGHKAKPGSRSWLVDMEALLRIDGRDPTDVARVLRWLDAGTDRTAQFWRTVVLSPAKLRADWVRMGEQYRAARRPAPKASGLNTPDMEPLSVILARLPEMHVG